MSEEQTGQAPGAPETQAPRRRARRDVLLWISLVIGPLVVALFLMLFIPWLRMVNEPPRSHCKNNLRQIGIALHLYADENEGWFPPDLARIYPGQTDNARIFSCPNRPSAHTDFLPGGTVTEESSSYTYVPGLTAEMPGPFIVAYDKSLLNHRKLGLNYLCLDSSVVWHRIADKEAETAFQRRLALQAEAVAKWRASGRPVKDIGQFLSPELQALMKWPAHELPDGKATR